MSRRLLITRPRVSAEALATRLEREGFSCSLEPLLTLTPTREPPPDFDGVSAVILTSAEAARQMAAWPDKPRLSGLLSLPCYVVGARTAAAARDCGFSRLHSADGNGVDLARLIATLRRPEDGALLHVRGEVSSGEPGATLTRRTYQVRTWTIYRAEPVAALTAEAQDLARAGLLDAVLLFSPRTAAIFAQLVRRHQLAPCCSSLDAICLSQAVAEAARDLPWRQVTVVARPEEESLIAGLKACS